MSDIVERLRQHEFRLANGVATMRIGRPEITTKSERRDLQESLDDAANEIERLHAQLDKAKEALREPKWKSAEKDNMEFSARITCWQMDRIRATLTELEEG